MLFESSLSFVYTFLPVFTNYEIIIFASFVLIYIINYFIIKMSTKYKIESGMQLLTRLIRKPEIVNIYPPLFQSLENGNIIEISCDTGLPLLIDIISEALASRTLHGKDIGIIHFNTDGNLNYDLLVYFIRRKISSYLGQEGDVAQDLNVERKLYEALGNFYILEINDATQLCTSIHNLENILMEHSNISLVTFDTLTAFYWSEQGYKITKMDSYVKNLLQTIQKVTKEYKVTCVYTRPQYFTSNKDVDHIESWLTETLNYKIEINKCEKYFKANVKTKLTEYTKYFQVIDTDSGIKWLN